VHRFGNRFWVFLEGAARNLRGDVYLWAAAWIARLPRLETMAIALLKPTAVPTAVSSVSVSLAYRFHLICPPLLRVFVSLLAHFESGSFRALALCSECVQLTPIVPHNAASERVEVLDFAISEGI